MRLRSAVLAALGLGWLPVVASAQNLVVNPEFEVDLSGWTEVGVTQSWIPDDAPRERGAMEVAVANSGPNFEQGWSQSMCFPVDEGEVYTASGWIKIEPDAPTEYAELTLFWYESPDCTGPIFGTERGLFYPVGEAGTWERVERTDLVAPLGVASGAIVAYVFAPAAAGEDATARFDAIFVAEPSAPTGGAAMALALGILVVVRPPGGRVAVWRRARRSSVTAPRPVSRSSARPSRHSPHR